MANPTIYKGTEYRSRLVAQWVAFLHQRDLKPETIGDGVFLITDGAGRRWRVVVRPFQDERRCLRALGQHDGELGGDDERWPLREGFMIVGVDPGINAGARKPYGGLVYPPWHGDWASAWNAAKAEVRGA